MWDVYDNIEEYNPYRLKYKIVSNAMISDVISKKTSTESNRNIY